MSDGTPSILVIGDTRSGSTILAAALSTAYQVAYLDEFLQTIDDAAGIDQRRRSLNDALADIANGNGFVAKAMYHDLLLAQPLRAQFGGVPPLLTLAVTRIPQLRLVHVVRRETIDSAYSQFRAIRTGVHHAGRSETAGAHHIDVSEADFQTVITNARERMHIARIVRAYLAQLGHEYVAEIDYADFAVQNLGAVLARRLQLPEVQLEWDNQKLVSPEELTSFKTRLYESACRDE